MTTLKSTIRTERSLVAGELSHHGKPCVPETPLASSMKPKLRGATTHDINLAHEWRHALKDYSQDSILLMLAIVYNDWQALQRGVVMPNTQTEVQKLQKVIAGQREELGKQAAALIALSGAKSDKHLRRKIAAVAPAFDSEALQLVRRKFQELQKS